MVITAKVQLVAIGMLPDAGSSFGQHGARAEVESGDGGAAWVESPSGKVASVTLALKPDAICFWRGRACYIEATEGRANVK